MRPRMWVGLTTAAILVAGCSSGNDAADESASSKSPNEAGSDATQQPNETESPEEQPPAHPGDVATAPADGKPLPMPKGKALDAKNVKKSVEAAMSRVPGGMVRSIRFNKDGTEVEMDRDGATWHVDGKGNTSWNSAFDANLGGLTLSDIDFDEAIKQLKACKPPKDAPASDGTPTMWIQNGGEGRVFSSLYCGGDSEEDRQLFWGADFKKSPTTANDKALHKWWEHATSDGPETLSVATFSGGGTDIQSVTSVDGQELAWTPGGAWNNGEGHAYGEFTVADVDLKKVLECRDETMGDLDPSSWEVKVTGGANGIELDWTFHKGKMRYWTSTDLNCKNLKEKKEKDG